MALGKKLIDLKAEDIIKGVSTSTELPDGGFSPDTFAVNLINTPGVAYQPAKAVDASTNVAGELIASCENPSVSTSIDRVFVDDEGQFYTWNGTAMTLARTDGAHSYVQGKTDMAAYRTSVFATSASHVTKWDVDSGFNATYYAFTGATGGSDALVPHPCLTYEDNIYYGNGQLLLRQTGVSSAPAVVLTLPEDRIIVTLAIDPGSGKMLISTTGTLNLSNTRNSLAKVYYYDGRSNKTDKVVQVEAMITAFPTSEGALYAASGNSLGYWNGSGVSFLREFNNITFTFSQLFYKHHFTNIDNTLYFIVRNKIYAHGPIRQGGEHVFYPAFNNFPAGVDTDLTHIANVGSDVIGLAYATDKFFTWNIKSISTGADMAFFSNEYDFDNANDGVWIRRFRIFTKATNADGVSPFSLTLYNQDGIISSIGNSGVFNPTNNTGAATAMFDIPIGGLQGTRVYQLIFRLSFSESGSLNPGIRRIQVFGDPANQ